MAAKHMSEVELTQEEANVPNVRRKDHLAHDLAFIDCKRSGSHPKQNYVIIWAGVTSSREQAINLPESRGFARGTWICSRRGITSFAQTILP